MSVGTRWHMGRIGHDEVIRAGPQRGFPTAQPGIDGDIGRHGVGPGATHRVRADVKGGDVPGTQARGGDGHHTASGAQIENGPPANRVGLLHGLDQEQRIMLWGINTGTRGDWRPQVGIQDGQHWPFGESCAAVLRSRLG